MSTDTKSPLVLSFVIPARNEAGRIRSTIAAVIQLVPSSLRREIIVVDNGSDDDTALIARDAGATVYRRIGGTIAAVRNWGANLSSGDVLVFLDGDVLLTEGWVRRIPVLLKSLQVRPRCIAGSWCQVPSRASWIERWWFAPQARGSHTHIGAAHLITTRTFFEELAGFDETLETGEDYDFSRRALRAGGELIEDVQLVAVHKGNPRTLRAFVRREIWHGRGDLRNLRVALRSKVVAAAALFGLMHLAALASMLMGNYGLGAISGLLIATLCGLSSYRGYRHVGAGPVVANAYLYYWYFVGRLLAFADRLRPVEFIQRDSR